MLTSGHTPPVDVTRVTGREVEISGRRAIQSKTDLAGFITQASRSLAEISGFSREELVGQPHNILRHPDMPDSIYYSMWKHLQAGDEFYGFTKNRAKNGDHYWVLARFAPIRGDGGIVGYTSARFLPQRDLIEQWERLYAEMRAAERDSGFDDERRFQPALALLERHIRSSGARDLSSLVLRSRA